MGKLIERCAGIDIGKRFLLCCVMTGAAHEEPRSETRRFDTTVPGLKRLRNWLNEECVTDVVMESTGSYWIPVFNLLEGHVTVVNRRQSLERSCAILDPRLSASPGLLRRGSGGTRRRNPPAHATLYVSESLHTVTNHSRSRPTFGSHDLGRDRTRLRLLSNH